jgi:hypothetical protein
MNPSINIDVVVSKINGHGAVSCSLAEDFIDTIRPYQLSDSQAVSLFNQVKQRMNQSVPSGASIESADWALLSC